MTTKEYKKSSSALASHVSKALTDAKVTVRKCRTPASEDGCRVTGLSTKFSGLPTARVTLDYFIASSDLALVHSTVRNALRERGYWIVEAGTNWLVVAPHFVNYEKVQSSDPAKPDYIVRLEAGSPKMCNCPGFMYRLTCRHMTEVAERRAK